MYDDDGLSERQKEFLKVFESNLGGITATCKAVGVHRSTFYRWQDPDHSDKSDVFTAAVHAIKEGLVDRAESVLYEHVFTEKSLDAVKYYLDRKGKDRGYVAKSESKVEHDVSDGLMDRMNEARKRAAAAAADNAVSS